ncbi:MAG: type I 3-dehydroquinate dehydratase [Lachnospiraceae bacterium]|nr:type I 3-dehydroquinate dehydratase [Lachnospiraceae bacterium]
MKKAIIKKGGSGYGKPLICVPVVKKRREDIFKAAKGIVERGASVLEWRMDWYEQVFIWTQVEEILKGLADICKETLLLCTFRSRPQGGELEIAEEDYRMLLKRTAESGYADLLDVEVKELSEPLTVFRELHQSSIEILASQHYFSHTPETETIVKELRDMKELGADIGKIAVMPQSERDVLHLMEATVSMKEQYPDYPIITMSMGKTGVISRISGQVFGSCMTFGAVGKVSAPGQLPMEDLKLILDKIAESLE